MNTDYFIFTGCPKNKWTSCQTIYDSCPKNYLKQSEDISEGKLIVFFPNISQVIIFLPPEMAILVILRPVKTCLNPEKR